MSPLEIKKEITNFSHNFLEELVDYSSNRFFDPGTIKLNFLFHERFWRSWGGINSNSQPFISLSLNDLYSSRISKKPIFVYSEYDFIKGKSISGFVSSCWKTYLMALITHEFSHVLQFSEDYPHGYYNFKDIRSLHNKEWTKYYVILRKRFVNEKIT